MSPDRAEELFDRVLDFEPNERPVFLAGACGNDVNLRRRVEDLLMAHEAKRDSLSESDATGEVPTVTLGPSLTESPGTVIDRYKLLEKLGEGGFGEVWAAEQREPVKRRVALKVIKLGMDTKQVVARFEAERQALALMDHPNIAKVLDAGSTEAGRPYFVMELVKGIPFTKYCDQEKLSTQNRLDLFMKACHAIQHAHQKGIIHRDIKPSNILVTLHDGVPVPKVIDFGIAKATQQELTEKTIYTQHNQFIGTPAYMSPEQAEMSGLDIDTRSDIYSLGVLLYELLTGATPFDAKELMSSGLDGMRKIIRETEPLRPSSRLTQQLETTKRRESKHPAIRNLRSAIDRDLDWIVMKCLEKDRSRRYETANGLAADLRRHLNNEPVVARPPSAAYRFQKAWRRNKAIYTAVATVALALIVGIGVSTWQATVATRAKNQAKLAEAQKAEEARNAQEERDKAKSAQNEAEAAQERAAESQRQSRLLLYAADMNLAQQSLKQDNLGRAVRLLDRHRPQGGEEDLRGWEWRYLWQLTRGSPHVTLTNRPVRGWDVSFSRDGKRLAVGWNDGQVDLWDVPGRRLIRTLTDREDTQDAHVSFSPVRNLLAATFGPGVVTLYDLDSGKESKLWQAPDQGRWAVARLAFSLDGSKLAIYAASLPAEVGPTAVWVVDVSSSEINGPHRIGHQGGGVHSGGAQLSPEGHRLYLARNDNRNDLYSIQCLDLVTGDELWQTDGLKDSKGLSTLALSPDGRVLASGSGFEDSTIRVWDAATGLLLDQLVGHTRWVCNVAFSKDGQQLISGATDQTIRFWDTSTWTETRVLRGHRDEVHAVAISEAAQIVASASKDGDLILWNAAENSASNAYIRLSEDLGRNQVKLLDHSRVLLLPPGRPPELLDLRGDFASVPLPSLGSSTDVLDCFGNILCRWNGTNQILIYELRGDEFAPRGAVTLDSGIRPTGVAYNDTRQLLAWTETSSSNSVYLANLATLGRPVELRGDVPGLIPVGFSEEGNHLLCSTGDESMWRVWNIESEQIVASINEGIADAVFGADGRVLVTTVNKANDHEIAFYDLASPNGVPRRIPWRFKCIALAVTPDGGLVASTTRGGELRLFDPAKAELIETLHGHMGAAGSVAFSPDGRRLVSHGLGSGREMKLWDVGTRQELLTLSGARGRGRWTADGNVILAAGPMAWCAPTLEEISAAEAKDQAEKRQP